MMAYKAFIIGTIFIITGCTSKAMYQTMQTNEINKCMEQIDTDFQTCTERHSESYEEYDRQRQEILDEKEEQ